MNPNLIQGDWMTVDTGDRNIRRISETLLFKGKDRFKVKNIFSVLVKRNILSIHRFQSEKFEYFNFIFRA